MIRDILRETDWHEALLDLVTFAALGVLLAALLLLGYAVMPQP